jgi:hypothetical protein
MKRDAIVCTILLLGMIDQIEGEYVLAEVTQQGLPTEMIELPSIIFPCEISEGDFFYVNSINGVTEIRCGEPPE